MKKTVIAVTAICLAAVLLCGAACLSTVAHVNNVTAAAETADTGVQLSTLSYGDTGATVTPLRAGTSTEELAATEIYTLACEQVVGISSTIRGYNTFGQLSSAAVSGTGFIISEDGYILTNNHVVEDAYDDGGTVTVMLHDGSEYPAEIVGVASGDTDVAVLKIEATGLKPVTFGDSDEMLVGEDIYVVGNPLGELTYTMTAGIVSALDRAVAFDSSTKISMFQLDAAVNSGNSGGPVYNACGEVIGVVTAKYGSYGVEGLGFAIPINDAVKIAEELVENGYISRPWFGIIVATMTAADAEERGSVAGAYVSSVEEGSCAEEAGIKAGDVITALGDTPVTTTDDLSEAKKAYRGGDSASVTVYRDGETLTLDVTFDEEPRELPAIDSGVYTDPFGDGSGDGPSEPRQQPGSGEDDSSSGSWYGEWSDGFGQWADGFGEWSEGFGDDFGSSIEDWFGSFFGRFFGSEDAETEEAPQERGGYRHFGN